VFYKCTFFVIKELVDKKTFDALGESAWMLFRQDALISLESFGRLKRGYESIR